MAKASKETRRVCDTAVADWLTALVVDYGQSFNGKAVGNHPIFTVFSSPERAFASMYTLMVAKGFIDPPAESPSLVPDDVDPKQIPMPFARVQGTDISPSVTRHLTPGQLRTMKSKGLTWTLYKYPTPYELSYTIEFVSKTQYTINAILEWFHGQFTPVGSGVNSRFINAVYPDPYGTIMLELELESISNESQLEARDAEDRLIRWTATVRLKAWDFDLVGTQVRAVMDVATSVRTPGKRDRLGIFSGDLLGTTYNGVVVYDVSPLPAQHTLPFTTADRVVRDGMILPYADLPDNDQFIETTALPFLATDLIQGMIQVTCALRDDPTEVPPSVRMQIVWRDSDNNFSSVVVQELNVSLDEEGQGTLRYVTAPQAENLEVSVRLLPADGSAPIRAIVDRMVIARKPFVNLAPSPTFGVPHGTTSAFTVSGLTPGMAYVLTGFLKVAGGSVDVSITRDVGETDEVYSAHFEEDAEIAVYFTPSSAGILNVRLTQPGANDNMEMSKILCARAIVVPFEAPA